MKGRRVIGAVLAIGLSLAAAPAWAEDETDAPGAKASSDKSSSTLGVTNFMVPPASRKADVAVRMKPLKPVMNVVLRKGTADGAARTEQSKDGIKTTLAGDVNFEPDSPTLTERAKQILDGVAGQWATDKPSGEVSVVGHTDSVADDAHNQTLSEQRAASVKAYLEGKASGVKIAASGKGETQPAVSETNPDGSVSEVGKAANRRVEIRWKK